MTKIKNKGFSLIEIVIAIAILTILLIPIVQQIAQTGKTNRQSKQQQRANEAAVHRLEQFQSDTMASLSALDSTAVSAVKTCYVFDLAGNAVASTVNPGTSLAVNYTATKYNLGTRTIGRNDYTEDVIMDDLPLKLMSVDESSNVGYKVSYNRTSSDVATYDGKSVTVGSGATQTTISFDFKLTNEGSIVSYDSDGFINAVVVENASDYVQNPNEVNLGNIQNLQLDSVALIQADALLYDKQANTDFMAQIMDWMKVNDPETWDQTVNSQTSSNILKDNGTTIKKVTKVYIDEDIDTDNKTYYLVQADVYYYPDNLILNGVPVSLTPKQYTVYSQKFYTKDSTGNPKAPDVYMEYEPYVEDNTPAGFLYASTDTILVDNYIKDAKIYLISPKHTQAEGINSTVSRGKIVRSADCITYKRGIGASSLVDLVIANVSNNVTDTAGDGKPKDPIIYTNVNATKFSVTNGVASPSGIGNIKLTSPVVEADGKVSASTIIDTLSGKYTQIIGKDGDNSRKACNRVYSWADDVREETRLYTVTVNIKSLDDQYNSISMSGARGDN